MDQSDIGSVLAETKKVTERDLSLSAKKDSKISLAPRTKASVMKLSQDLSGPSAAASKGNRTEDYEYQLEMMQSKYEDLEIDFVYEKSLREGNDQIIKTLKADNEQLTRDNTELRSKEEELIKTNTELRSKEEELIKTRAEFENVRKQYEKASRLNKVLEDRIKASNSSSTKVSIRHRITF